MIIDLKGLSTKDVRSQGDSKLITPLSTLVTATTETQNLDSVPKGAQVVRKVLFTRTELTIYPNGVTFPGKTTSWFQGGTEYVKKKVKKTKTMKKVTKNKEEVF